MICPKCKKIYSNRLTFCISCGVELVPEETLDGEITDLNVDNPTAENGVFSDINITEEPSGFVREIKMSKKKDTADLEEAVPIEVKSEPTAPKGKRLLKNTAAGMLSAVLFGVTMLTAGSFAGRILTSEKNVAAAVESIDLLNVPAGEIGLMRGDAIPVNATVEEAITVMTTGSGVDSGNIRKIYESSTLKSFMGDIATDYAEFIRNGTKPENITAQNLKDVFAENLSIISKNTGYTLSERDIQLAYQEIDNSAPLLAKLSVNNMENSTAAEYIRLIRAYISLPALLAEIIAVMGVVVLIAVTVKSSVKALDFVGVPLLAAGAAMLIINFMFTMQIGVFSVEIGVVHEIIKGVSAATADSLYRIGAALAFVGAAALVWSASFKRLKRKIIA